jgi:hypothetical protein
MYSRSSFSKSPSSKTPPQLRTPKTRSMSIPTPKSPKFQIAQFNFSNDSITNFKRWVKKPRDCVLNTMELLGILDSHTADIARIIIGDIGVEIRHIEQICELVYPEYKCNFYKFTNLKTLTDFTSKQMEYSNAIFCGYQGHAFVVAKYDNGNVYYIDPQINTICNLDDKNCFKHIANKDAYFVLQKMKK